MGDITLHIEYASEQVEHTGLQAADQRRHEVSEGMHCAVMGGGFVVETVPQSSKACSAAAHRVNGLVCVQHLTITGEKKYACMLLL